RLQQTSETVIALQFLVMNLEKILRDTFFPFFYFFIRRLFLFQNCEWQTIDQNKGCSVSPM
ncbi:hypothetical protein, partial [Siminovitchia sp. 179-K 8D1 HS]|uniref:hypothetical protein n=1 Tax=Siminovitchia sp. 179-K 8D1 HS TaxID=3142385 RepID=UPI0039A28E1B